MTNEHDPADSPVRALRAAIYSRNSGPRQATIPHQISFCRKLIESKGHRLAFVLCEQLSAKNTDRPQLHRLMQLVEEGRIDVIVVWKLDRFVRSLRDLLNTHKYLEARGVSLQSYTEQFDTSSSFGRFSFRNIASAAELERELNAERVAMGRMGRAQMGKWVAHATPLGYKLMDGELRFEAADLPAALRILDEYARGLPMTEIAGRLTVDGIFTRSGVSYSARTIGKIVHNPIYVGRMVQFGIEVAKPELRLAPPGWEEKAALRHRKRSKDHHADQRRKKAVEALIEDYFDYLAAQDSPSNFEPVEDASRWSAPKAWGKTSSLGESAGAPEV